jgi:predicted nucleotidyltransferase
MRVPGVPSLIALKLHAIKSNPDRLEKDGRDIAELLKQNPDILDRAALETLFTKYGCSHHFSPFSHLAK